MGSRDFMGQMRCFYIVKWIIPSFERVGLLRIVAYIYAAQPEEEQTHDSDISRVLQPEFEFAAPVAKFYREMNIAPPRGQR